MLLREAREKISQGRINEALTILDRIEKDLSYPKTLRNAAGQIKSNLTEMHDSQSQTIDPTCIGHKSKDDDIAKYSHEQIKVNPYRCLTLTWDTRHNCLGRGFVIHKLAERIYKHATLAGFGFNRLGEGIWEPLKAEEKSIITLPEPETARDLFKYCHEVAGNLNVDLVIACKPRLPSILLGCLIKMQHNCPLIIDIDDYELGFLDKDKAAKYLKMSKVNLLIECVNHLEEEPFSDFWTVFSHSLIYHADEIITSNTSLQKIFGGLVLPHVRDSAGIKIEATPAIKKKLNVEDKSVVMFLGTPRKHKGVLELARAIKSSTRANILLVFVGTFKDSELRKSIEKECPSKTLFIDDIPFSDMPAYLSMSDLVVLLQSQSSTAGIFQLPAKAIDALMLNIQIIATKTEPIEMLLKMGFKGIHLIENTSELTKIIEMALSHPLSDSDKFSNEQLFKDQLSFESGTEVLEKAIDNSCKVNQCNSNKSILRPLGSLDSLRSLCREASIQPSFDADGSSWDNNSNDCIDVILWKQNDFGIFGRRVDMIADYLGNRQDTRKVFVFERPISTFDLDKMAISDNKHYALIRESVAKKVYCLNSREKIAVHTPLLPVGLSDSEKEAFVCSFIEQKLCSYLASLPVFTRPKITLWIYPYYEYALGIIKRISPSSIVVDIVDDHTKWPGISEEAKLSNIRHYQEVLSHCDVSIYNCEETYENIGSFAKSTRLLIQNGADANLAFNDKENLEDLKKNLLRPGNYRSLIGYAGNLESKIDWELVKKIAVYYPSSLIMLIGSTHMSSKLPQAANILYTGPLRYEEAVRYISVFDVAIVPHLSTNLTKSMNPLKLFVYAACGIPIVSTAIPNLPRDISPPQLNIANNHDLFLSLISGLLAHNNSINPAKIEEFLARNSWESRLSTTVDKIRIQLKK